MCIWDGNFIIVQEEFYRLTNYCAVCFVDMNVIAAIVVKGRTKILTLEAFSAKCEPFVLINYGTRARWDEGCTVEVKFPKEGVAGG